MDPPAARRATARRRITYLALVHFSPARVARSRSVARRSFAIAVSSDHISATRRPSFSYRLPGATWEVGGAGRAGEA